MPRCFSGLARNSIRLMSHRRCSARHDNVNGTEPGKRKWFGRQKTAGYVPVSFLGRQWPIQSNYAVRAEGNPSPTAHGIRRRGLLETETLQGPNDGRSFLLLLEGRGERLERTHWVWSMFGSTCLVVSLSLDGVGLLDLLGLLEMGHSRCCDNLEITGALNLEVNQFMDKICSFLSTPSFHFSSKPPFPSRQCLKKGPLLRIYAYRSSPDRDYTIGNPRASVPSWR